MVAAGSTWLWEQIASFCAQGVDAFLAAASFSTTREGSSIFAQTSANVLAYRIKVYIEDKHTISFV